MGRGGDGLERGGRAQAPEADPRVVGQALGTGVGQGGQGGGLAEVDAAKGFSGSAAQVGCGAHLRLDLPQPEDGQGLRERLCATGEAFVYAAMTRLMVRRLARA